MAKCIAPECVNGKVFGEVCRVCQGTGDIPPSLKYCPKCKREIRRCIC